MPAPFLELVDISKTYPGVVALDHVGLSVARGEVIACLSAEGREIVPLNAQRKGPYAAHRDMQRAPLLFPQDCNHDQV